MDDPKENQKADPETKKIILIDDDDHVRQMVQTMLELEGFQVRTLRDGRNILKESMNYLPDLIITDLMMPGGSGYEVLRSLQSEDVTRKISVVVITGHLLDKSTKEVMKQEPNVKAYMDKPLQPHFFLKTIHTLLNTLSKEERMVEESNRSVPDIDLDQFRF